MCHITVSLTVLLFLLFFFFNDTPPTEIYTLSLHDALPISRRHPGALRQGPSVHVLRRAPAVRRRRSPRHRRHRRRSEEHTSELQSHSDLVCRLLLEKKKTKKKKVRAVIGVTQ